jgi:hypothetical protein
MGNYFEETAYKDYILSCGSEINCTIHIRLDFLYRVFLLKQSFVKIFFHAAPHLCGEGFEPVNLTKTWPWFRGSN